MVLPMTPVGTKRPNGFGLHDMHGNVFAWCQDWFDSNYYSISPKDDPAGPENGKIIFKYPLKKAQEEEYFRPIRFEPVIEFELAALDPAIAVASTRLPGQLHGDPADRLLAATARQLNLALVTADEKLLAYGAQGHLAVISAR